MNIKIDRAYYIYVTAPQGYLLLGGMCNDDVPGWECPRGRAARELRGRGGQSDRWKIRAGRGRGLDEGPQVITPEYYIPPSVRELELGLREGRSERCVRVDRFGMPESHLDVGVMRVGDTKFEDTDVHLSMDLIEPERRRGRRSLSDAVWERLLQQQLVGKENSDGSFDYVLLQKDKDAIGVVTAEGKFVC